MSVGSASLKAFDVFPKTVAEFRQKTAGGGIVSIACVIVIAVLTLIELGEYLTERTEEHLYVDTSRGHKLPIHVDMVFPALPCSVLQLQLHDASGNDMAAVTKQIAKLRLDRDGSQLNDDQLPKVRPVPRGSGRGPPSHRDQSRSPGGCRDDLTARACACDLPCRATREYARSPSVPLTRRRPPGPGSSIRNGLASSEPAAAERWGACRAPCCSPGSFSSSCRGRSTAQKPPRSCAHTWARAATWSGQWS